MVPLTQIAETRWPDRRVRRDERPGAASGPGARVLPSAMGGRIDHGHPRPTGSADAVLRADRGAAADRRRDAAGAGARRPRGDADGRSLREDRLHSVASPSRLADSALALPGAASSP